jgi:hypothetical protein
MRWFRLGELIEHVIDLLVSMNVVWMFDHPMEVGNHPESDLDSLLVSGFCFLLDSEIIEVNSGEILRVIVSVHMFDSCLSVG